MFSDNAPTVKSFPVRPGRPYLGRSGPSRFASTKDANEVADIVVMGGRFFAMIDGRRIELRHTREALAALRGR